MLFEEVVKVCEETETTSLPGCPSFDSHCATLQTTKLNLSLVPSRKPTRFAA